MGLDYIIQLDAVGRQFEGLLGRLLNILLNRRMLVGVEPGKDLRLDADGLLKRIAIEAIR